MSTQFATQIQTGWDVYGSDGEKIGTVADVATDHFVIEKGFIFTSDIFVPLSAVASIDDDEIDLIYTKDQVENQHWSSAPVAGATSSDEDRQTRSDTYDAASVDNDRNTLERRAERLTVDKQRKQAGTVRVGKHVEEQVQAVDVPVTREEVTVERRAVDRPTSDTSFTADSIEVPVYEERVDVDKEARVVEELDVNKTTRTDTERVEETVRHEEFDIDESGTDRPARS